MKKNGKFVSISGMELARCREKAGFTQEEIAAKLKKNRVTVARWERNAAVRVTESDLELIKSVLGVTTEQLQKPEQADLLDSPLVQNYKEHIRLQREMIDILKRENEELRRRLTK